MDTPIDFLLETLVSLEHLSKTSKPLPVRHCNCCKKKMRVIKNDYKDRKYCKTCFLRN